MEVNGYTIGPGANFTRADLAGANLHWAGLGLADLKGARADRETIWPDGFDPEAAGVIFE